MPEETERYIMEELPPTDILVVDALTIDGINPTHYNLKDAVKLARRLKPKRTFVVGIACDRHLPHNESNKELEALDVHIQFAHDGLFLEI